MGQYGPFNEAKSGGYRLTLDAYAKYVFFFTWRVGAVAKTYKRKKFLFVRWWSGQKADSIQIDNTYYTDKFLEKPGDNASKTCTNAKKCKLERGQMVFIGEPEWKSVSAIATARIGNTKLETAADAEFGQG